MTALRDGRASRPSRRGVDSAAVKVNPRIRFGILGPLQAAHDGREVDLGGPKPRRLLAALLVERGRPVPDDRLVELLWGDAPPASVGASLQAYVSNLRAALRPDPSVALVRRSGGYLLQLPADALDADRFEVDVAAARAALAADDPAGARLLLEDALSAWRGAALAELEEDPLVRAEAARLEELRLQALEARAEAALAMGDAAAAVVELQALLGRHPLRERLCELLMIGLYRTGRQADALAQARTLRDRLAEELGVDPGPSLAALETAILRQDPELELAPVAPAPAAPPPAPAPTAVAPAPTADRGRLVGRAAPLATLQQAWADAAAGRGGLVLVSGEAGIGKSRLVEALADHVLADGGSVRWGRCFETAGAPVLWPWVQVLRAGFAEGERPAPDDVALLAGLLPDQDPSGPTTADAPVVGSPDDRFGMLQAIARTVVGPMAVATPLAHPAASHPPRGVLVVVEDLHWADPTSMEVLEHLAPLLPAVGCMVVATHRDTAADMGPVLPGTLARLARQRAVTHVPLGPLDDDALRELASEAVGAAALEEVVTVLGERSDGNPLFAGQLLAVWLRGGRLPEGVPHGLRALLADRIARLPDATRAVLRAAAVVGRDFSPSLVATATSTGLGEVLAALDPAAEMGIVVAMAGSDRYRFTHVLLRDSLYDTIPPGERIRLHATIGLSLEADGTRVAEAAHHLRHGAPLGLAGRAADAALRAADRAQQMRCWTEAEGLLRGALDLVGDDVDRERRVLTRLATLQLMTAGYTSPDLRTSAERLAALAHRRDAGIPQGEAELATWARWVAACTHAEHEHALDIATEAVALADPDGPAAALATAHEMKGTTLWHMGQVVAAHESFEVALIHIDRLDANERRSPILSQVVQTCMAHSTANLWAMGEMATALSRMEQAVALARPVGPFAQAFARQTQAYLGVLSGDWTHRGRARWAMEVLTSHGHRQLGAMGRVITGWHDARAGDPRGLDMAREGLDELAMVSTMMLPAFGRALGDALEHHDRMEEAAAAYDTALAVAERTGEHMVSADLLRRRGRVAARLGEPAGPWLDRARELAEQQGATHLVALCTSPAEVVERPTACGPATAPG